MEKQLLYYHCFTICNEINSLNNNFFNDYEVGFYAMQFYNDCLIAIDEQSIDIIETYLDFISDIDNVTDNYNYIVGLIER